MGSVPRLLFHTTDAADEILSDGFRDGHGDYGILVSGVFLSSQPSGVSDGATGDRILQVEVPDDVPLDEYAIIEEGHAVWEWCVPSEVVNTRARVRLLTDDEVDRALS